MGPHAIYGGQPVTFTAQLAGAAPAFNWTVSAGTISSGQGTASIMVETKGLSGVTVTAAVEVPGSAGPCASRSVFRTRILGLGRRGQHGIGFFPAPPAASAPEVDSDPQALLERGQALHRTGDFAGAVACYRKAAGLGDARATYLLGLALDVGRGAAWDGVAALGRFKVAADRGIAGAQFQLATRYFVGDGVGMDHGKALGLLTGSATQSHIPAQVMLGKLHEAGVVVALDQAKSIEWLTKAAEQGDVESQRVVGNAHYFGRGVPKDVTKSAAWHAKAAERGDAISEAMMGYFCTAGVGVPKDEAAAITWLTRSAVQGNAYAQRMLGGRYRTGRIVAKDAVKAVELYTKAAEQGDLESQKALGAMYYNGEGIPKDHAKSAQWYGTAAAQGDAEAQYQIGRMHHFRQAPGADPGRAKEWIAKAAAQGHEFAKKASAELDSGRGLVLDAAERPGAAQSVKTDWALQAALERGDVAVQLRLARMYKNGVGRQKDPVMAYCWFTVAAANGSHEAARERDAMGATLTPAQSREGFNKATAWIQVHGRKAQ